MFLQCRKQPLPFPTRVRSNFGNSEVEHKWPTTSKLDVSSQSLQQPGFQVCLLGSEGHRVCSQHLGEHRGLGVQWIQGAQLGTDTDVRAQQDFERVEHTIVAHRAQKLCAEGLVKI